MSEFLTFVHLGLRHIADIGLPGSVVPMPDAARRPGGPASDPRAPLRM